MKFCRKVKVWLWCLVRPGYVLELEDLIKHMDIHSNYPACGYRQMTTKQKNLFLDISKKP